MLYEGGWVRSIEVEGYSGHFWTVLMDLEAEILTGSKSFNAASAHMGLEGLFCSIYRNS